MIFWRALSFSFLRTNEPGQLFRRTSQIIIRRKLWLELLTRIKDWGNLLQICIFKTIINVFFLQTQNIICNEVKRSRNPLKVNTFVFINNSTERRLSQQPLMLCLQFYWSRYMMCCHINLTPLDKHPTQCYCGSKQKWPRPCLWWRKSS